MRKCVHYQMAEKAQPTKRYEDVYKKTYNKTFKKKGLI